MLQITALMDDKQPRDPALIAEHGLSFFVKYGHLRFLFDCGQNSNPLENAHMLNIDLRELDAVVLSHSHYDHAGGFPALVESGMGSPRLFTGPMFFEPKFARREDHLADLSCGFNPAFLSRHHICHREITGSTQIYPGVWLICGFPRVHSFETIPQRFLRQTREGLVADQFPDEICMVLETAGGLAVLVGCSHPGILNILCHVRTLLNKPIRAVFGGTHLVEADMERIEKTISTLKQMGLETIGFSHCSGDAALTALSSDPQIRSCHLCSGDSIELD